MSGRRPRGGLHGQAGPGPLGASALALPPPASGGQRPHLFSPSHVLFCVWRNLGQNENNSYRVWPGSGPVTPRGRLDTVAPHLRFPRGPRLCRAARSPCRGPVTAPARLSSGSAQAAAAQAELSHFVSSSRGQRPLQALPLLVAPVLRHGGCRAGPGEPRVALLDSRWYRSFTNLGLTLLLVLL